ncbi:MAG: type II toxin-antitoxin system HipA family toxin, partial [Ignavibacteriales bacterium]
MITKKCLYCYEVLENSEIDFHLKCSESFFGFSPPPSLDVNLSDIEKLALNILGRSTSVTGVQPKLSVDLKKEKKQPARLTIVGLWGRYILKPPYDKYPQMPENEDLTMKLAEMVGIKTARHSLVRLKSGELAYISKRFDRTSKTKLHVEDFAQLLEVLTERKYYGSIEQISKGILSYSSFSGNDLINLFELVLFSFITGNADMHLKNYSLIRDESDDIKLSPAYDLLST